MNTVIDFSKIQQSFRHAIFFSMFEGLKDGESFEFINDHDPAGLHKQVRRMELPNLEWIYEESGPTQWRISVKKSPSTEKKEDGGCCGICNGAGHHQ